MTPQGNGSGETDDQRIARIARRQNASAEEQRVRQIVKDELEDTLPGILERVLEKFTSGGEGEGGAGDANRPGRTGGILAGLFGGDK